MISPDKEMNFFHESSQSQMPETIEDVQKNVIDEANSYLKQTKFDFFLREMVKVMLSKRSDTPESHMNQTIQWFLKGDHVYLKPFSYILKNSYNKCCFLNNIKNLWGAKLRNCKNLTANDMIQNIMLLCNEVPISFIFEVLKCYSNYKITEDQALYDQEVEFDTMYKTFSIMLYYGDYNELLRRAFKTIQDSKSLDPHAKVPKEALLRYMCDYTDDDEINRVNEVMFLKDDQEHSGEKEVSYAMFMRNMVENRELFEQITKRFSLYEKTISKYEALKKIAIEG